MKKMRTVGSLSILPRKCDCMKATELKSLTNKEVVAKIGPLFTADQKNSGVLACVSMAQFILECGYGKLELAQNANNCFGMKKSLSGNTWPNSTWDGKSIYTKSTKEQKANGAWITIKADFRKYPSIEKSIADHSAYLTGAMNGSKLRYAGLKGCADYKKAAQCIKDGGYATDKLYVNKLVKVIEDWNLTQYNAVDEPAVKPVSPLYRVRKDWADEKSQIGAYTSLDNAMKEADNHPGYYVYDEGGTAIYPVKVEVKPTKDNLYRVRKAWGDSASQKGAYTFFDNAKLCVDSTAPGDGYFVFNSAGIAVYPMPYMVTVKDDTVVRAAASDIAAKATIAKVGKYTIVEVSGVYGKLKSGAGWLPLTDLGVTPVYTPSDKMLAKATVIGDYMVEHDYHYGTSGNESAPTSFKQSVTNGWKNSTCTLYCSWVLQAAGFLKEGKCLSHTLGNKSSLIDCEVIKVNTPFKELYDQKKLVPGDVLISAEASCGNNYGSIFAGYDSGAKPKSHFEAGGPFVGTNTDGSTPRIYTNIGPLHVNYDWNNKVEYIIRPTGSGNGGIDLSSITIK